MKKKYFKFNILILNKKKIITKLLLKLLFGYLLKSKKFIKQIKEKKIEIKKNNKNEI